VDTKQKIYEYLQQNGKSSATEIAEELSYASIYCARVLRANPDMFRVAGKLSWSQVWEHIEAAVAA
jgi:hypothetical protein